MARQKELYEEEQKTLNYSRCSQDLTQPKKEIEWLAEVDKFALQNSLRNLETAYKNFFADLKKQKKQRRFVFLRFKKKDKFKQSHKTNFTNGNIQVWASHLKLPNLGWARFHKSQEIDGTIVNFTATRTKRGKYIASILGEAEIEKHPAVDKNIGLDLGIKLYLVTSGSEEVRNPKHYHRTLGKLRQATKKLSSSIKGSNNRAKAKTKDFRFWIDISTSRKQALYNSLTKHGYKLMLPKKRSLFRGRGQGIRERTWPHKWSQAPGLIHGVEENLCRGGLQRGTRLLY